MADSRINSDFWLPVFQRADGSLYSPGVSGNTFSDNVFDTVYFGAAPTPGVAEVSVTKTRSMDKKKGAGTDGARITLHGVDPAEFDIRVRIWTPEQWEAIKTLKSLLFVAAYKSTTSTVAASVSSGPGAPATATTLKTTKTTAVTFDVSHPTLAFHKIKAVQVVAVNGPEAGASPQDKIVTFRCIEFLPPGSKNATHTDEAPTSSNALTASSNPMPSNTGP